MADGIPDQSNPTMELVHRSEIIVSLRKLAYYSMPAPKCKIEKHHTIIHNRPKIFFLFFIRKFSHIESVKHP
jgi:hypothetical protein